MNFDDVSKLRDAYELLRNVSVRTLVVYSKTSIEINNIELNNNNCIYISSEEFTKEIDKIDKKVQELDSFEEVITIGAGTATDIGKYISYKYNKKLTSIITMLSTNAYATDKVALIVDGRKETLLAKMPDLIIIDENIMRRALKFNLYGLADVFSIYTALKDWDISVEDKKDVYDQKIYNQAKSLLDKTIDFVSNNTFEEICNKQETIFYLVGEAGYITNVYGCGRPESGSEHIFAKELEAIYDVPHAIAVSNGIILMSLLQDNYSEKILKCLEKLNLYKEAKELGVTLEIIKQAYLNIKPRIDRYSIVDRVYDNSEIKLDIFNKFINIMEDYYHANN